jgi:8-oxo-dGTP pyrophosphatase MutT (NUDIX family)
MPKRQSGNLQVAAIPIRRDDAGDIEVLLVTSRETRRWVVPKGWRWPDTADHDAAAGEAWEEAGVKGQVSPDRLGTFSYSKRTKDGDLPVEVAVYVIDVSALSDDWPEAAERRREWFSPAAAAELVDEHGLKALLLRLVP